MFKDCTSLTSAPSLPATTLAQRCYEEMFNRCTSLSDAPYLPATTLVPSCYYWMFLGCSSLTSMNVEFTNWNVEDATMRWHGGASKGVFTKPRALSTVYGANYIPKNWTVSNK